METEFKIKIPEGMVIDKENSTFECIKFKPKNVTYDDISRIMSPRYNIVYTTSRHLQKCITFRKLLEVAEYINGDWTPDWDDFKYKYSICRYDNKYKAIQNVERNHFLSFQSMELAEKFLKNFKALIKKAGDLI